METVLIVSGVVLAVITVLLLVSTYRNPNAVIWGKSVTARNMTMLTSFWILVFLWAVWAVVLFSFF